MTASVLSRSLGEAGSRITLIESPNVPTIGVGEGTTPLFKRFLKFLGVSEREFIGACQATFKLGINFPGWTDSEAFRDYFHPFAAPGFNAGERQFFENCDFRRAGSSADTNPSNYFFTAELSRQGRAPAGPPPYSSDSIEYGYHFDTALLADFLKGRCLAEGVQHVKDDVTDVVLGQEGSIKHLVTANSGNLAADLFVDCTGFRRMLLSKVTDTDFVSYRSRLFNDSAVVIRTAVPSTGNLPPFTESTALQCGWAWRIPLMNKISWGYVYSSDYVTREKAEQELRAHICDASSGIDALHIRLQSGRVTEHWKRNVVAVGLSQGFIEPLEATALGLTQFTINRFVTHFTRGAYQSTYRDHFNTVVNEAFDKTIDYIQMHYKLTTRSDTQYWRDCRDNQNISDTMKAVISGWDDPTADFLSVLRQHVHRSSYAPYSWYCILSGMGRFPAQARNTSVKSNLNSYERIAGDHFNHREYLTELLAG